ncbi:MAG: L-seryl-tRNA(Sec) selenium transferase [Candidatus Omnitrophica bacterium]|nr:L-seryl-tRNA(Sec) selenium transferase [Candidatus Omnitrophota bacterium]
MNREVFSQIPQVEKLLQAEAVQQLLIQYPRCLVVESVRELLDSIRLLPKPKIEKVDFSLESLGSAVRGLVSEKAQTSLRPLINATGVILHTNFGRAPLSAQAQKAMLEIASGYSNLEFDPASNTRKNRHSHVEPLLRSLTNAEAALVVNNNAAAVVLVLNTFARKKEVVVSRGQLVEIGGSFRLPEIMKVSQAKLVEVGTTNITNLGDYEQAVSAKTALLLHVHTSNFKMVGFTQEVLLSDLVKLAQARGLLTMSDLGSGVMVDLKRSGFDHEITPQKAVSAGVDIITFSGDKLLGGPQAGIIVGKKEYIRQLEKNPLSRALRVDKLRLACLEATLRLYLDQDNACKKIPVLEMLLRPLEEIDKQARDLMSQIRAVVNDGLSLSLVDGFSQSGGGALPAEDIPTKLVALHCPRMSPEKIAQKLRGNEPPILARIAKGQVLFDPRTLRDSEFKVIVQAIKNIF